MPINEYGCKYCKKITEVWNRANQIKRKIRCECGRMSHLQISLCAGHTDGDVKWLESASKVLQPDRELRTNPIKTRSQYKKYLKDNNLACVG